MGSVSGGVPSAESKYIAVRVQLLRVTKISVGVELFRIIVVVCVAAHSPGHIIQRFR